MRAEIADTLLPAYIERMSSTVPRRSHCPTNYALEHFGDRWTLLVVRDLLFHGKEFYQDFLTAEESISTNILATRLKKMEADGLIEKRQAADGRRNRYVLSEKGINLARIMVEINRWSAKHDPETEVPDAYSANIERDFEALVARHRNQAGSQRDKP